MVDDSNDGNVLNRLVHDSKRTSMVEEIHVTPLHYCGLYLLWMSIEALHEWVSKLQTWGHNITNIPDQIQMNMTSSPYHSKHILHPSSRDPPNDVGPSCIHQNFAGVFPYIIGKGIYTMGRWKWDLLSTFSCTDHELGCWDSPSSKGDFLAIDWPLCGEWHGFMINLTVFKVRLRIHSKWSYW